MEAKEFTNIAARANHVSADLPDVHDATKETAWEMAKTQRSRTRLQEVREGCVHDKTLRHGGAGAYVLQDGRRKVWQSSPWCRSLAGLTVAFVGLLWDVKV